MGIVQEKYQKTFTQPAEQHEWVSSASARRTQGVGRKLNRLPPGTNIENQADSQQNDFPMSLAGDSDISADASSGLEKGFTKRAMKATDDEYTNQHNDAFYDDLGGFVERNNMLDRI